MNTKRPMLWQFTLIQLDSEVLFQGVILERAPRIFRGGEGWLQVFWIILSSYFIAPCADEEITVIADGQQIKLRTDKAGSFSGSLPADDIPKIEIKTASGEVLSINQSYPSSFPKSQSPLAIISDIDDTVMLSYSSKIISRLSTLFFHAPHRRKKINFTFEMLSVLRDGDVPVYYVSKSESNLFRLIGAFIFQNTLPQGPLLLTPFLKAKQLLKSKNKEHKHQHISTLINGLPDTKFVLIGDDSQRDLEIYTDISQKHPGRIAKIYIRKTGKRFKSKLDKQWDELNQTGVPCLYFDDDTVSKNEINFLSNEISIRR